MKINVNTTIRFNGREYSSPAELPPDARAAYRKALFAGSTSLNRCLDKITLYRRKTTARRMNRYHPYADILSVVENNGQVTLPVSSAPWFSRRHVKMVMAVLGAVAAVAAAVVFKTVG